MVGARLLCALPEVKLEELAGAAKAETFEDDGCVATEADCAAHLRTPAPAGARRGECSEGAADAMATCLARDHQQLQTCPRRAGEAARVRRVHDPERTAIDLCNIEVGPEIGDDAPEAAQGGAVRFSGCGQTALRKQRPDRREIGATGAAVTHWARQHCAGL
jgi:hypothetical protein